MQVDPFLLDSLCLAYIMSSFVTRVLRTFATSVVGLGILKDVPGRFNSLNPANVNMVRD